MLQSKSHLKLQPPRSPDLNPAEHLWDVVEEEISLLKGCQQEAESLRKVSNILWSPRLEELTLFFRARGGTTQFQSSVPNKVLNLLLKHI